MKNTRKGNLKLHVITLLFMSGIVFAQPNAFQTFQQSDFLLTSPGAMKYGLFGYENPANLNYAGNFNLLFAWADHAGKFRAFNRWGLFTNLSNLGFGMIHRKYSAGTLTNYKLSLGFGSRTFSTGLSYGWVNGTIRDFNRTDIFTLGLLIRPSKYISTGITGTSAFTENSHAAYLELAVRPLGNELISIFGDFALSSLNGAPYKRNFWSAGAAIELIPGLRITGRYFDSKAFSAGLEIGMGNLSLNSQSRFDSDQRYAYNTYGIRIGAYDRNLVKSISHRDDYLNLTLSGKVKYRRFRLFDNSATLFDIINQINSAKDDPEISGIVINASSLDADREKLWELRERLKDFRATGKKVVVFIERPDMETYHFASVADKIVLDPQGIILLQGIVTGRSFYRGTLEKIGVGFDEWRFFKYKSAYESYGRSKMSDPDREQRQELVDGFYNLMKKDICGERKLSLEEFDNIVNDMGVIIPEEALEKHLVDTLGRWDSLGEILKKLNGKETPVTGTLERFSLPSDSHWGEYNYIAIVYALGICDMNTGIAARNLIKDVEAVTNNPRIKAVILRVDSPGGDAMASDYIAEAIKKCKQKKPVIVSQGSVAASGGYWLSMYADTIIAAPNTITGSIGVIGGWAYNSGLKEKLGITTDYVKRGDHAELGFGAALPLIGIELPDRNLTDEERSRMERIIKTEYYEFVGKVASGRKLDKEYIDSIGQGRVWTGTAGLNNRLIDILGGLNEAIKVAKVKAGLQNDKDVKLLQYPEMPVIDLSFLQPKFFGFELKESDLLNMLKFRLQHNGQPLHIISLDDMDLIK